jgi:hypothetical protein
MTGSTIPYHLRQNKAVDRYAFIELLSKIDRVLPICEYRYIGFGGHSLEEYKYLHDRFNLSKMTSIEIDLNVFERQKFNQPYSCINLVNKSSEDFLADYDRQDSTIIWLDYTTPNELRKQVEEFQQVIQNFEIKDIIKITLNANASSYYSAAKGESEQDIKRNRLNKLKEILGEEDLFPSSDVSIDLMKTHSFPLALVRILNYASNLMANESKFFQPLTCFSYADGQTMVTVSGIILERSNVDVFLEKTEIDRWELKNTDWFKPRAIDIPDFTIRERLFIDQLLPQSTALELHEKLKFKFDKKDNKSIEMIENYITFYRQSPYFSRIVV